MLHCHSRTGGRESDVVKILDRRDTVNAVAAAGLNVFWNAGPSGQDLWAQGLTT